MRVLIVEDQKVTALSLAHAIHDAGYDVVGPAFTSQEALSLIRSERLDAAFVDVDLEQPGLGIGIAQELAIAHVAVIFTTAYPDRVRACGTGLGLFTKPYIAANAVRALRWIEERMNGRSFELSDTTSFECLPSADKRNASQRRPGPILLVEDHPNDIELATAALQFCSSRNPIVVARDGQEALEKLMSDVTTAPFDRPALVILDLKMPGVDGFEVLCKIKQTPQLRSIPVVVFTSSADSKDIQRSYQCGATAVLTKPSDFDEYRSLLSSVTRFWVHEATHH